MKRNLPLHAIIHLDGPNNSNFNEEQSIILKHLAGLLMQRNLTLRCFFFTQETIFRCLLSGRCSYVDWEASFSWKEVRI